MLPYPDALLLGCLRHHILSFRIEGSNSSLTVLIALAVMTLIVPNFTTTTFGPTFSDSQLIFAGVVSLVLYGTFVFIQTIRPREYFLQQNDVEISSSKKHALPPSNAKTLISGILLLMRPVVQQCFKGSTLLRGPFPQVMFQRINGTYTVLVFQMRAIRKFGANGFLSQSMECKHFPMTKRRAKEPNFFI